jgi:hypothetical protein
MNYIVKEHAMPELNFPEVKLPKFKLPDVFRDMSRDDIVNAARDVRMPKMPDMPEFDLSRVDFSKLELPKQIEDRMPGRKRSNPLLPIAGFVAIGAAIAAAWWLITSPVTGPRVRGAINHLRSRVTGGSKDLVRYDGEADLDSLLTDSPDARRSSMSSDGFSGNGSLSDLHDGVPAGMSEAARSN